MLHPVGCFASGAGLSHRRMSVCVCVCLSDNGFPSGRSTHWLVLQLSANGMLKAYFLCGIVLEAQRSDSPNMPLAQCAWLRVLQTRSRGACKSNRTASAYLAMAIWCHCTKGAAAGHWLTVGVGS
eukprot:1159640-Pelagomonas_calceolata.AAC.4